MGLFVLCECVLLVSDAECVWVDEEHEWWFCDGGEYDGLCVLCLCGEGYYEVPVHGYEVLCVEGEGGVVVFGVVGWLFDVVGWLLDVVGWLVGLLLGCWVYVVEVVLVAFGE